MVACSDTTGPSFSDEAEAPDGSSQTALQGTNVDNPPKLVGGMTAVRESIVYPEMAKEAGIEGRVVVQFVVDEEGSVTHPTVARGAHELLNKAALETIKSQTFNPGRKEGEPVPVQMSFPVTFRLPDEPNRDSDASSEDATPSGIPPNTESGGRLFEKAGIQLVRVLMNEEGALLLDKEPITVSGLTDAVRRRITKDAARAVLLYADGAPADRVAAAEARLNALNLQNVYVKKVK
jgi:TonB family protein